MKNEKRVGEGQITNVKREKKKLTITFRTIAFRQSWRMAKG